MSFKNVRRLLPVQGSIRFRLVAWNTLTTAGLFILMGVVLHLSVGAILMGSVDRELWERTQHIVDFPPPSPMVEEGAGREPGPRPPDDSHRAPPRPEPGKPYSPNGGRGGEFADYRPRLIGENGQIIKPGGVRDAWDHATIAQAREGQIVYSIIKGEREPLRVISRRFSMGGASYGVIQDVFSLANNERILATVDRALLLVLPLALLCAAAGSALATGRSLNQIRSFTASAQQLTAQDLSRRLPVSGQDEFATLADTFNAMVGRLEASFAEQKALIDHLQQLVEQQRRFTSDASHELRTPLTAIKANTSLFLSGEWRGEVDSSATVPLMADIDQAATAMSCLVDDLLLLARSDEGQLGRNRQFLELEKVVEGAVLLVTNGKTDTATLQVKIPDESLLLYTNPMEIQRLFINLIVNALHYTPQHGQITVSAGREDGFVRIRVADTGIGIDARHLAHLGERFYRVDSSRSRSQGGTGLGLSICKGIVAAHGGSLHFESRVGVGTTVTVLLPAEPQ